MKLRLALLWILLAGTILAAWLAGGTRFEYGSIVLHFPGAAYYAFPLGPQVCLLFFVFAGISLVSCSRLLRRGAEWICERLSSSAHAAVFCGLLLVSFLQADCFASGASTLIGAAAAFVLILALLPWRLRLGIARKCAGIAAALRSLGDAQLALLFAGFGFIALMLMKVWFYRDVPFTGDGASSLFQAYVLASGHLKLPAPAFPDFFTAMGVIADNGWFSMYPPGHPALLALGVFLNAPWIIGPLSGAATIAMVWLAGARWFGRRCGAVAACLAMANPHWLAMSPSYMSHTSASLFLMGVLAALALSGKGNSLKLALFGGIALGLACATRPWTGFAMGLPHAMAYMIPRLKSRDGRRAIGVALAGVILIGALFALYNWGTLGDPFELGHRRVHKAISLGFGGELGHTPEAGFFQTLSNVREFSKWGPGCFPGAIAMLGLWFLAGRFGRNEITLACAWLSLPVAYFFYFYQDFALGPRFLFECGPPAALLGARGLQLAAARVAANLKPAHGRRYRSRVFLALGLGCAIGAGPLVSDRLGELRAVHAGNLRLMEFCRELKNSPNSAVFIDDYHQGIVAAENLKRPQGPLLLQYLGEERNRQFMDAHPERKFYIYRNGNVTRLQ